jgi:hypothetical protein
MVNSLGLCVCEICGTQSGDHAGWFAVTGGGNNIEILPWQENLRARPDCHHACCGDHLQQLIFSTAARELAKPSIPLSLQRGGWNPATLVPPADAKPATSNEEAILNVLSEIDSVLQGPTAEEEEEPPRFDA